MAQRGRPRKPNHIKEAQGTLEKSRVNEHPLSFEPLSRVPEPPGDLNKDGRAFYVYICQILINAGLLTAGYLFDIERAAFWYSLFKDAQREIELEGYYQESETGWRQIKPSVQIIEKATKYLNEFDGKYGLNLVAGQKIEIPENKDEPEY